MVTFDGWDARICGDALALPPGSVSGDYLMHFRTKGSKNGVRRYQQADGSWTPLGLKLRKEREGWGESKKERKAEKKAAKAEKRAARASAIRERAQKKTTKLNSEDLKNLSADELRKKIEHVELEQKYKELTRSPIVKSGEHALNAVLGYIEKREEKKMNEAKMKLEKMRYDINIANAKANLYNAKNSGKEARYKFKEQKWNTLGGLRKERKAKLKEAKIKAKELRGSVMLRKLNFKRLNNIEDYQNEINKGQAYVQSIIKGRIAVDSYNSTRPKGLSSKMSYVSDKNAEDRSYKLAMAREQTALAKASASKAQAEARKSKYNATAASYGQKNKKDKDKNKK